ncbi:F-box domain-containing protein [Pleurotus pulmonarius]
MTTSGNILDLPPELLEDVLSQLDSTSDLLHLALSCKAFSQLIIPHHIYTRSLDVHPRQVAILSLLTNVPLYNSRIRTIRITDSSIKYNVLKNLGILKLTNQLESNRAEELPAILAAMLPQFTHLTKFAWTAHIALPAGLIYTLKDSPQPLTELDIQYHLNTDHAELLSHIAEYFPRLRSLTLNRRYDTSGTVVTGHIPDVSTPIRSANWPDLTSFTLFGFFVVDAALEGFLRRHPKIERLGMDRVQNVAYPSALLSLTIRDFVTLGIRPTSIQNLRYANMSIDPWSGGVALKKFIRQMRNLSVLECHGAVISWDLLKTFPAYLPLLTKLNFLVKIGAGITVERLCSTVNGLPNLTHFASVVPNTEERPQHTVAYVINKLAQRSKSLKYIHVGPDGRDHRLKPHIYRDWYKIQRDTEGEFVGVPVDPADPAARGVLVSHWEEELMAGRALENESLLATAPSPSVRTPKNTSKTSNAHKTTDIAKAAKPSR